MVLTVAGGQRLPVPEVCSLPGGEGHEALLDAFINLMTACW